MNKAFSIKEAFNYGYRATIDHFQLLCGITIITLLANMAVNLISHFAGWHYQLDFPETRNLWTLTYVIFMTAQKMAGYFVLATLIPTFFNLGYLKVGLELYDQKKADFKTFFSCAHLVIRTWLASMIYGAIVIVGLMLLILPGIYLAIRYMYFMFFIVDKDVSIQDSFKQSAEITRGNVFQLFVLGLILFLVEALGALLLGIGLIFTTPVAMMAAVYVYRKLSGNPSFAGSSTQ